MGLKKASNVPLFWVVCLSLVGVSLGVMRPLALFAISLQNAFNCLTTRYFEGPF